MDKENILAKIKKLFALGASANQHEAELAMQRANELLLKHNLSIEDIDKNTDGRQFLQDALEDEGATQLHDKFVFPLLQKYFFVSVVLSPKGGRRRIVQILGRKDNVDTAISIHKFLVATFKKCFLNYKRVAVGKANRQSYYYGLYSGLNEKLTQTRQVVEQETTGNAIKLYDENKALQDFVKQTYRRLKHTTTNVTSRDRSAYSAGYEAGRRINIGGHAPAAAALRG